MAFGDIEEPEDPNIEHTFSDDFDGSRILDKNMYAWQVNDVVPETIRYTLSETPIQGDPIFGLITMTDHNNISTRGFYQSYNWNIYDQPTTTTVRLNSLLTPGIVASSEVMTRKVSEDTYVESEKEPEGLYIGNKQITPVENILTNTKKYNIDINTFLGDVDANGILQRPTEQSDLVFTGVTDVASYGLYYRFAQTKVKNVSFPNLTTISGSNGCQNMFYSCEALTSASFPNLTTVDSYGCYGMFGGCIALTSVSLPNLTTVDGYGCYGMFNTCTALTSASFPNLTTISGNSGCNNMFGGCTALTSVSFPNLTTISSNGCHSMFQYCTALKNIYFPALTTTSFGSYTNQFGNMMSNTGTAVIHTIHFPSNLESTIQSLTGYPTFNGTDGYIVLAFDLPATE